MNRVVQILLLLLRIHSQCRVESVHLQQGQCPLKVPSSLSTKSSTQLSQNRRSSLVTIAHRGASFSLPEHTLPAYRLALELGADYIEPDLVATKDGKLVAVHDINLNITTNVDQLYPDRYRTIEVNGQNLTGYFVFDFTLQEVKLLRVKQRIDARSKNFDWFFGIPTLHDILDLLYEWNGGIMLHQNQTRRSGVYMELKSPEIYQQLQNTSLADVFLEDLAQHPHADEMFFNVGNNTVFGCEMDDSYQVPPLVIQCFDGETLKHLRNRLHQQSMALPPFVLLVNKRKCHSSMFWFDVGRMGFLSGIGPDKICILDEGGHEFMIQSKKLNLAVHPWAMRAEMGFVSPQFRTAEEELRYLYCKREINGIFTENVNLGVEAGFRGCDDYMTAEELLEEDINELEEREGGRINGTVSKEICRNQNESNSVLMFTTTIISGVAIGSFLTFIFRSKLGKNHTDHERRDSVEPQISTSTKKTIHHGNMKGMQALPTIDSDEMDMEII